MDIRFRSIDSWPYESTPSDDRAPGGRFKAPWARTLEDLDRELRHLDATDVTVECFLLAADIRLDGWPRSGARIPVHPGVALHFDSNVGHLRYATDVYETYQANIRAIALGLEALRAVDRYGITQGREQYRGFAELPAGIAVGAVGSGGPTTPEEAALFLFENCGPTIAEPDVLAKDLLGELAHGETGRLKKAKREALVWLHPDTGGDPEAFKTVNAAVEILERYAAGDRRKP